MIGDRSCCFLEISFAFLTYRSLNRQVHAVDANSDGKIGRSELAAVLHHIGADVHQLEDNDLQAIMDELGEDTGNGEGELSKQIHLECVEDLILNAGKQG